MFYINMFSIFKLCNPFTCDVNMFHLNTFNFIDSFVFQVSRKIFISYLKEAAGGGGFNVDFNTQVNPFIHLTKKGVNRR